MVDFLFIINLINSVILLLVTATYLVEFSYRHQNYTKKYKDNPSLKNDPEEKYKNLRFGKAADGASYAGCVKWQFNKCKSFSKTVDSKEACKEEYDHKIKDSGDPTREYLGFEEASGVVLDSKIEKYTYCTNEWYKWSASRFIPAILALFFAIVEILSALEKVDIVKGLTYGFWVRIILFFAFGLDILGVSGDLGMSAGIILLVLTLVWIICFFVGSFDPVKIGAN
jgi:hypothetical protein